MRSPARRSTPAQLKVGSAPRKIKPGLSTTRGGPSRQVLAQSTHGCAARGRLCQSSVPTHHPCTASLRCRHPALTHATPRHAMPRHATSSCPWPRLNFRPTRRPESPDFSCTPHANIAPPRWIWQGGTPTQRRLGAALLRRQGQHPWVDLAGSDSPSTTPKPHTRGVQAFPRSKGAPGAGAFPAQLGAEAGAPPAGTAAQLPPGNLAGALWTRPDRPRWMLAQGDPARPQHRRCCPLQPFTTQNQGPPCSSSERRVS